MPTTKYHASRICAMQIIPPRPVAPLYQWISLLLLTILLFYAQSYYVQATALAAPLAAPCDFTAHDEASLQAAINCTNAAGAGAHTITVTQDILLTQPSPLLTNPTATQVTIEGNGHTINANGHGRVLTVESIQNLLLHNLTLTGGNAITLPLSTEGGGVSLLCGEDVVCNWHLLNTVVRNNQATAGGGIEYACGYHGAGNLLIEDSVIRENQATQAGGGLIYHTDEESFICSVTVRHSLFEGNQAVEGGAIRLLRPRVTIIDSTLRNNSATENGGGLLARISDGFIDVTVRNSTVSGNHAGLNGGGFYIDSPDQTFNFKLINTTISSNTVASGAGGGLYLRESNNSLRIALINSTVAQNSASQGGGVHIFHLDNTSEVTSTLRLTNTLIAANQGGDCANEVASGNTFNGQGVVSYGHNLDSDGTCLPPAVRQTSDIPNGDARVGPLADNGGRTLTHALLPGSQALDAGNDAVCAADPVNGVDQRGITRPQGVYCDIGAVEMQTSQSITFTVTKFTDSNDGVCDADCSLREAIAAANHHPGRDEIHLASGVYSATIPTTLDGEGDTVDEDANAIGDLDITDDLWLLGSGATTTVIDGNHVDRVFEILANATVTVEALTIQHGRVSEKGAGLSNSGQLTLNHVHIIDNVAASGFKIGHGGGIFNDGSLTLMDSLVANNQAQGGEASYGEGGGIRNDGVMTILRSTVRANGVSDDNDYGIGGGIVNQGTLRIDRSTLTGNHTAGGPGGGIVNRLGGVLEVVNSTLSGNQSGTGGGLANGTQENAPGTVLLMHTTIANNTGGGLDNRGVTTSTNTIIAGNAVALNANPAAQNCFNTGTFVSLGATLLGNTGNCPNNGSGDLTVDNTTVFTSLLQSLADNGGPTLTHALVPGSVAVDSANDAACADTRIDGVDQRGETRPQGAHCDIGAYEAAPTPPPTSTLIFVSAKSSGQAGGVKFRDEDILAYNPATNQWQKVFDGSDVGVTKDVDAFYFMADGSLLLSFNGPTNVPGLGPVDDSDIVRFIPTALGDKTAGSFAWYLHGADVGLTTDGEDIDAIGFTADGHLIVSTIGDFNTPTAHGHDEDLFQLNDATFGNPSSGTWSQYFVGANVGLANEDVNGLWIDPAKPDLYLTVKDSFAFGNEQIDGNDIFVCTLSQAGACTYRLFWDAAQHGYSAKHLDSIGLGALPSTFSAELQPDVAGQGEDDPASDDDIDDLDVIELNNTLFLPVIQR